MKVKPLKNLDGIFAINGKFVTINLVAGERVYGEELIKEGKIEYRVWDYYRSKPAAALKKGITELPIKKGMKILYLGIASGTTASHFSDIVGKDGVIYGVEIAERVLRLLIDHAEKRGNIITILGDGRKPEEYANLILEKVDVVYEDVADPDQIEILLRNCEKFLKNNGYAIIAIKSQSIDVTKPPQQVYKQSLQRLKEKFEVIEKVELDPYEKGHLFVVLKMK